MQQIDTEFITPFIESTRSAFEIMLDMKINPKEAYIKKNYVMFGDISGSVGISGNVCGNISVSFPAEFAIECIRTLIHEESDTDLSDSTIHDGIGELINIVVGSAKATLAGTKNAIEFSLPTIISGRGHEMYHREGTCNTSILFEAEPGKQMALDICVNVI